MKIRIKILLSLLAIFTLVLLSSINSNWALKMVHEDVILIREDVIVKSGKLSHIKSLINKLE